MEVKGKIIKILEVQKGTSKKGTEWQKLNFVIDTNTDYNNIICFEIFGKEKIDKFVQYNKVGDVVEVSFNINTNEYQGKYYTTLSAWKVWKGNESKEQGSEEKDDLPF